MVVATDSHWVVALELATGEERWRFQVPGARGVFSSAPAIQGGLVLVGCQLADALYSLDLATGEVCWRRPELADLRSDICLVGDLALVSHSTGLYALDPTSGEEVWHQELAVIGSPAAAGELVFMTLFGGELAALSLPSGKPWRPGVAGDRLLVVLAGEERGWLISVEGAT